LFSIYKHKRLQLTERVKIP